MDIRPLGRSGFEVKSSAGTVLIDPSPEQLTGPFPDSNTIVVFSLGRGRVSDSPAGVAQIIDGPGEYEVGGVSIRGVGTPADDPAVSRKINTVYVIDGDGVTVCSLGALGNPPDNIATQQIGKVNVLLLDPETTTMSADDVAGVARSLEPDVIAPAGYDADAGQPGAAMKALLNELGVKSTEAQPRLTVSRTTLPDQRTTVVLAPRAQ